MSATGLISHLAADCALPRDVVRDLLEALGGYAVAELVAGHTVILPRLGRLTATVRTRLGAPQVRVAWWSDEDLLTQLAPLVEGKGGLKTPAKRGGKGRE